MYYAILSVQTGEILGWSVTSNLEKHEEDVHLMSERFTNEFEPVKLVIERGEQ